MTFRWTHQGDFLTSTCTLCATTITGRRDNDVTFAQRAHDAFTCQMQRAQTARAGEDEVGQRIARALFAADEGGGMCCGITGLETEVCDNGGAKTNRPTRERRTVLSTPSTNRKEAVDS